MRHNTLVLISLQTRPKYLSFITYYGYLRFAFLCYLGDKNSFRSSIAKKISWICPPIRNQYCRYRTGRKLPSIRKSISGILGEGGRELLFGCQGIGKKGRDPRLLSDDVQGQTSKVRPDQCIWTRG